MIYVITLAYAPPKMLKESLKSFYETFGVNEYKHIIVDNHWPRNRNEMLETLKEASEKATVITPEKNLGLAGGFNFAFNYVNIKPEDTIIIVDPDCFPITYGWGKALIDICKNKSVGWASLWNVVTSHELSLKPFENEVINSYKVAVLKEPILNSICAFPGYFLIASKGAHEVNPYYGGFEIHMWPLLKKQNLKWVFLKDFLEGHTKEELIDPAYKEYKYATTHGGEKQVEFSEWLKLKGIT